MNAAPIMIIAVRLIIVALRLLAGLTTINNRITVLEQTIDKRIVALEQTIEETKNAQPTN